MNVTPSHVDGESMAVSDNYLPQRPASAPWGVSVPEPAADTPHLSLCTHDEKELLMTESDAEMDHWLRAAAGRCWTPEPELLDEADREFNDRIAAARDGKSDQLAREVLDRG